MKKPKPSSMFCDDKRTVDAMIEFAVQKGLMTKCECEGETHYHYEEVFKHADEIIMTAKAEGLVALYEDNGTCYRLTSKGEDWYAALHSTNSSSQESKKMTKRGTKLNSIEYLTCRICNDGIERTEQEAKEHEKVHDHQLFCKDCQTLLITETFGQHWERTYHTNYTIHDARLTVEPKTKIYEIIGPDGKVHYRRPEGHKDLEKARQTKGYYVRLMK